ncbi:hypothetical protein QQ045_007012 [Rhodiola kirilowii]
MEEDGSRRMSSKTRKVASKMTAALQSNNLMCFLLAALARLDALENDNAGLETVDVNDDEEASPSKVEVGCVGKVIKLEKLVDD